MNSVVMKSGYGMWYSLFSSEELEKIDEYALKNIEPAPSIIGTGESSTQNEEYRSSTIYWIRFNSDTSWIFDKINRAAFKLNSHLFGFEINYVDVLQYTIYNEGHGHYDWHWDMFIESGLNNLDINFQRKLSAVIVCKNCDEGGQLELKIGDNKSTVPKVKEGDAVVFPSFTLHQVTPVIKGVRKTLVAWLPGPDWK